jgi:two-component system chemotaxis response regulator CheY
VLSVLIADDSLVMRRMVARSLELSRVPPHELREASNGAEALGILRDNYVDIVLCDLHMPVMDGLELVKTLGADPTTADVPVVIVSSERSAGLIAELEELGVRGYLLKPFQPEALGNLVRQVLRLTESA